MTKHLLLLLALSFTSNLYAARVFVEIESRFHEDTYNVYFTIDNSIGIPSTGLATYNIGLIGLSQYGIDPETIVWTQNGLENFNASFMPQGIQVANLLEGAVGTDAFSAVNSQFNSPTAVFGIGVDDIHIFNNIFIPAGEHIILDQRALLGSIEIPGTNSLTLSELAEVFSDSNAALFTNHDSSQVVLPDSVKVCAQSSCFPEPSTALISLIGIVLLPIYRRRPTCT